MLNAAMIYQLTLYISRAFTCMYLLREIQMRIASDDISIDIIHVMGIHIYVSITRNSDD